MMKFLFPLLILIAPHYPSGVFQSDYMADMSRLFKAGDSKEIAKNFNNSVALSVSYNEDVYSKVQAEQILREFLEILVFKHEVYHKSLLANLRLIPIQVIAQLQFIQIQVKVFII